MHTLTLVSVSVPDCTDDNAMSVTNQQISQEMKRMRQLSEKDKNNFMAGINYQMLQGRRDQFSRAVVEAVGTLLEPYGEQTEDYRYLEFVNVTERIQEEYESDKVNCIKKPEGIIVPGFRLCEFMIKDGKVYQRSSGPLHHEKRTKKAKKMTALPDYPCKKLYKTFAEYAEEYCGYRYYKDKKAYGYFCNPNSFYDWYSIGGRWPFVFLVKDTCKEFNIGEWAGSDMEVPEAPEGYLWCCAARKKDIEWQVVYEWRKHLAMERFSEWEQLYNSGKESKGDGPRITERGVEYIGQILYYKGETQEQFLARLGYNHVGKYYVYNGAVLLSNGEYRDAYEFRDENCKPTDDWRNMVEGFIDKLSDDAVLVGVDCHV